MLTQEQRQQILTLARQAITEFLLHGLEMQPPGENYLLIPSGAFVTLKIDGQLRGCIGFPEAIYPLGEAIVRAAIYAATEDPRFPNVTADELKSIDIEVSVLSPARLIADPSEIVVGEHGLILTYGHARGLLLPQVPVEWGWDRDQYLKQICRKAGVFDEAWRDPRAKIEVFTAEVFGETPSSGE
ncbi:MAG TPA: AmmeMemoRadiSam system protein A [Acidobacteriota bacterium]|nr:AmmeMemoRadiSam system protein A [Acidobacteriota bacterium]